MLFKSPIYKATRVLYTDFQELCVWKNVTGVDILKEALWDNTKEFQMLTL